MGHHAESSCDRLSESLRCLDARRVPQVLFPQCTTVRMTLHASIVDGENSALPGVGGIEMSDLETLAALRPERFEGLLPLCVSRPIGWLVAWREDFVFVVISLLDDVSDFVLGMISINAFVHMMVIVPLRRAPSLPTLAVAEQIVRGKTSPSQLRRP